MMLATQVSLQQPTASLNCVRPRRPNCSLILGKQRINGYYKRLADELHGLLPLQGKCEFSQSKNKHLDKFRRAQNAAYDLFNNGLINRRGQFNNIFGFILI